MPRTFKGKKLEFSEKTREVFWNRRHTEFLTPIKIEEDLVAFYRCVSCKKLNPLSALDLGHIVPWKQYLEQHGVTEDSDATVEDARVLFNDLSNLAPECATCNRSHDFEPDNFEDEEDFIPSDEEGLEVEEDEGGNLVAVIGNDGTVEDFVVDDVQCELCMQTAESVGNHVICYACESAQCPDDGEYHCTDYDLISGQHICSKCGAELGGSDEDFPSDDDNPGNTCEQFDQFMDLI